MYELLIICRTRKSYYFVYMLDILIASVDVLTTIFKQINSTGNTNWIKIDWLSYTNAGNKR